MAEQTEAVDEASWHRLLERVKSLPPERQEEIVDYIGFILDRQDADVWDLSDEDRERMARHLAGDVSDAVALEDVEGAIRRGAVAEL